MIYSVSRRPIGALISILLLALLAVAVPSAIRAQESAEAVIRGTLVHGADLGGFQPQDIEVSLNVFEGVTDVESATTRPDADGNFEFPVSVRPGRFYFVSLEYQGARYSASREVADVHQPMAIRVFESTDNADVIRFESYTIIVTGAVAADGFVEVLERVMVRNDSGMTLVPDRESPGAIMLNFLRFGLPPNYYNLDVGSTLVGGSLLEVDRGFALDMPVPPTGDQPHEFEFVYRLPYNEPNLDLSRVMRFGVDTLRIVVPVDVGRAASSQLEDLGVAESGSRFLRLLEGRDIPPGETLDFRISELPMPSAWARFSRVAGDWYLQIGAPSLVALAALVLLVLGIRRKRANAPLAGASLDAKREALLGQIQGLESSYRNGNMSARRYQLQRNAIKSALVDIEVQKRFPAVEA